MIDKLDITQYWPTVYVGSEIAVCITAPVTNAVREILMDMGLTVLTEEYTFGTTVSVDDYIEDFVNEDVDTTLTFTFVGCYELDAGDNLEEVDFSDCEDEMTILGMMEEEVESCEKADEDGYGDKTLAIQTRALFETIIAHESWHKLDPATDGFANVRSSLSEIGLFLNIVGGEIEINKEDVRKLGGIVGHVTVLDCGRDDMPTDALLCVQINPVEFEHINNTLEGYRMYTIRDFNGQLWVTDAVSKGPAFQNMTIFVKGELVFTSTTANGVRYSKILIGGLEESLTPEGRPKDGCYQEIAWFMNKYAEQDLEAKIAELNAEDTAEQE